VPNAHISEIAVAYVYLQTRATTGNPDLGSNAGVSDLDRAVVRRRDEPGRVVAEGYRAQATLKYRL
jgi:hypothetical protein